LVADVAGARQNDLEQQVVVDHVDPEELAIGGACARVYVARDSEYGGSLTAHAAVTDRARDGIRRQLLGNGSRMLLRDGVGGRLRAVNVMHGTEEAMDLNESGCEAVGVGRRQFQQ